MAKMICCKCKLVMETNIETASGKDSHSLCPKCEAEYMAEIERHAEEKLALQREKKRLADIEEKALAELEKIRIAKLEELANEFKN